jgi:hypothetical protein
MLTFMKRALFFVLFSTISIFSLSQNLVNNEGFEIWKKTNNPTGWTNKQGCLKDSAFVLSGKYSCRQTGTSDTKELAQYIVVSEMKQYSFSFFYNTDTTDTGNGCRVWCSWKDVNDTAIDDPSSESVLHSGFLKSAKWQQFSADVTSPAGAVIFCLLVRTLPKSITYWDDFKFEEIIVSDVNENMFSDIEIYPNPATDYLNINNTRQIQHIDIISFTGIMVWSSDFSWETYVTIPLSGMPDGLYIIKIVTTNRIITRKFIKKSN